MEKITIILECILGLVIIGGIFYIFLTKKKDNRDDIASEFFNWISSDIKNILIEEACLCVEKICNKEFDNVEEFESYVLDHSSDRIWELVDKKVDEAISDQLIPGSIKTFITREYVSNIIQISIKNFNIAGIYNDLIVKNIEEDLIEKDKELEKQFSSDDFFDDEEEVDRTDLRQKEYDDSNTVATTKLVKGNVLEPIEEQVIIPPKEEETDDNTVIEEV